VADDAATPRINAPGRPDEEADGGRRSFGRIEAEHERAGSPTEQPERVGSAGFPEPAAVTSTPLRRATNAALGKVPRRYAIGVRSATRASSDIPAILCRQSATRRVGRGNHRPRATVSSLVRRVLNPGREHC
jgi:hypothetical protein